MIFPNTEPSSILLASVTLRTLPFHALMIGLVATTIYLLPRRQNERVQLLVLAGLAGTMAALIFGGGVFAALARLAWWIFVYVPLLLMATVRGAAPGPLSRLLHVALPMAVVAVGLWSFAVEPFRLEITRHVVTSEKLDAPLRLAVMADLQTDHIGDHERAAIRAVMAAKPDLILWTGDYLQVGPVRRAELAEQLRRLLAEEGLSAPLGVFAVRGDVEGPGWVSIFDGTTVDAWPDTRSVRVGGIRLTGLAADVSRFGPLPKTPDDGFHVMFGHAPEFAMLNPAADLLLAGHTHGGQVRLPWIGPLITFSEVPRAWAAGRTEIGPDRTLLVSRGIGMERGAAPRLRFLCRPEVMIVDLRPKSTGL